MSPAASKRVSLSVAFGTLAIARPAGSAWSAPAHLSAAGKHAVDARVGIAAAGEAVTVWGVFVGSGLLIESASRP